MTIYHLRGTDGTEVFTGTIQPPPGGGSVPAFVADVAVIGRIFTGIDPNLALSGLYGGQFQEGQRVLVLGHIDSMTANDDGFYIAHAGAWTLDTTYNGESIPTGGQVTVAGSVFYAGTGGATDVQTVQGTTSCMFVNTSGPLLVGTATDFSPLSIISTEYSFVELADNSVALVLDFVPYNGYQAANVAHASASTASNTAQLNAVIDALIAAGIMVGP